MTTWQKVKKLWYHIVTLLGFAIFVFGAYAYSQLTFRPWYYSAGFGAVAVIWLIGRIFYLRVLNNKNNEEKDEHAVK